MRLLKMNAPEKVTITIGIIASIIQGALMPLYAILFGEFLKVLSMEEDEAKKKSNEYALWFVALGLGAGGSMFLLMYMFAIAGEALTTRLRKMTFESMLKQDLAWYDDPNNSVGALCARLSGDCAHVQGATGSRIGSVVQSVATIGIAIGLSFYYSPKLGAVALVFCPFVVVATFFQMKLMTGQSIGEKKAVDEASKIAVQAVGNIRTVASLTKERAFVDMYQSYLTQSHL
jgi:ATP-binding cassette subfamily B (MDR/TAP) protein 1